MLINKPLELDGIAQLCKSAQDVPINQAIQCNLNKDPLHEAKALVVDVMKQY